MEPAHRVTLDTPVRSLAGAYSLQMIFPPLTPVFLIFMTFLFSPRISSPGRPGEWTHPGAGALLPVACAAGSSLRTRRLTRNQMRLVTPNNLAALDAGLLDLHKHSLFIAHALVRRRPGEVDAVGRTRRLVCGLALGPLKTRYVSGSGFTGCGEPAGGFRCEPGFLEGWEPPARGVAVRRVEAGARADARHAAPEG
jgi:hypothetical protein